MKDLKVEYHRGGDHRMKNRILAFIGLKVVIFGITILESVPFGFLSQEDKDNLNKLWEYHDAFKTRLK